MASLSLNVLLAGLTLLTPITIHLFFPVIPAVKAEFGVSDGLAQLTFSVGVFALAFSTLAYGSLGDRFGRRPVLLAGLAIFLLGSIISAMATSTTLLIAGRLIQALGAGCGITLARAIARDVHGAHRMVKSIAYLTMAFAIGGLSAPAIGGLLVDQAGWRAVFVFTSLAGIAVCIGTYCLIPATQTPVNGSGVPPTGSAFLQLARFPRFCALVIHTGCSTATFLTLATASSVFMKEQLHRPATEFGLYFAMVPVGFVIGTLISSRIGNRAPVERMVLVGASISLISVLVQSALLMLGLLTPLVLFVPGAFITFAQGLSLPFAQAGAMETIPRYAATAAGIGVFMQNFMGAGVAQIYGLLANGTPTPLVQITVFMATLGLLTALIPSLLRPYPGA